MSRPVLLLLALVALPQWAFAAERIPLSAFAAHPAVTDVRLSPDGESIVTTVRDDQRSKLMVLDTRAQRVKASMQFGAYEHFAGVYWLSPKRLIIAKSTQVGTDGSPLLDGDLVAVDSDGRNSKTIHGVPRGERLDRASAFLIRTLDDERSVLAQISNWEQRDKGAIRSAYKIDAYTGTRVLLASAPIGGAAGFVATRSGQVLYVSVDNPPVERHFWRSSNDADWQEMKIPDGRELRVERIENKDQMFVTETSGTPKRSCVSRRALGATEGGLSLLCYDGERQPLVWSFDDREPIAVRSSQADGPHYLFFDEKHPDAVLLRQLTQTLAQPDSFVYLHARSRDGNKLLLKTYGSRYPDDYYLFDRKTGVAELLLHQRPAIDPQQMAGRSLLKLPESVAHDPLDRAYLSLPNTTGKTPPALIVRLVGGFDIEANWGWYAETQMLASRGYAVLDLGLETPPHDSNPTAPDPAGALAERLLAQLRWLRGQNRIDASRICVIGTGYGGYVALTAALRDPQMFRCIAVDSAIVDIDAVIKLSERWSSDDYWRKVFRTKLPGVGNAVQSPLRNIEALRAPVLILHDADTGNVSYQQSTLLSNALDAARKPYQRYVYPDSLYLEKARVSRYEKLLDFLGKPLGETSP